MPVDDPETSIGFCVANRFELNIVGVAVAGLYIVIDPTNTREVLDGPIPQLVPATAVLITEVASEALETTECVSYTAVELSVPDTRIRTVHETAALVVGKSRLIS
jgi:hypothetical protein